MHRRPYSSSVIKREPSLLVIRGRRSGVVKEEEEEFVDNDNTRSIFIAALCGLDRADKEDEEHAEQQEADEGGLQRGKQRSEPARRTAAKSTISASKATSLESLVKTYRRRPLLSSRRLHHVATAA